MCGEEENLAFKYATKKYGDIKVRGCYNKTRNSIGTVTMKIPNEKVGKEIEKLVYKAHGSLRCDYTNEEWTYFECE